MRETVLVLGSGPIRIGQGIEFDYSCVHCVWALQELGYRAIILNNNPETVSTDFDTGDGLYFEPVTLDDVLRIVRHESPIGVVVQYGGQTAINLAQGLARAGVRVLGTSPEAITSAEDRDLFEKLLGELGIPKPPGRATQSLKEAEEVASQIGYPVLVRPSFVLGGRAMEIAHDLAALEKYYLEAEQASPGQPVLVDKYLYGIEAEVDVISDGKDTLVPGIMEHIERAGVHSGDSMAVYPPVTLSDDVQAQMVRDACKIARALDIRGLMNIQFVVQDDQAYVLEVNPRASRTVPYLSKVTGVPMTQLSTKCMMGLSLEQQGYRSGLWIESLEKSSDDTDQRILPEELFKSDPPTLPKPRFYAVKAPVFSFQKLMRVEPSLGPEMKSTGEILGVDFSYEAALYKAFLASGIQFKSKGAVVVSVADLDKPQAIELAKRLSTKGFRIIATPGTHEALAQAGIASERVHKIKDGEPNLLSLVQTGGVSLMINTPSPGQGPEHDAVRIRRACIESGIACVTSIDTAVALAKALAHFQDPSACSCLPIDEYLNAPHKAKLGVS